MLAGKKKPNVFACGYTSAYAAPEILSPACLCDENGGDGLIDGSAADVWSVAVVIYFLLTGMLPFEIQRRRGLKAPDAVRTLAVYKQWLQDVGVLISQGDWVSHVVNNCHSHEHCCASSLLGHLLK